MSPEKSALLEARKRVKGKKPTFIMHEAGQRKELPMKWRKPRGLHNKQRLGKKGHAKRPGVGFRSPAGVRGLHSSGVSSVVVHNTLFRVGPSEAIVIGRRVGRKKRAEILKRAQSEGITVLNPFPLQEASK